MNIDLDKPIVYKHASFRFFAKNEHHTSRLSTDNVLLLVYDGVLRFSEEGVPYEIGAGEYFIQRSGLYQSGELPSDAPKYLYVHFDAEWCESEGSLRSSGKYDVGRLFPLMERMDAACHKGLPLAEQQYIFLKLLLSLRVTAAQSDTSHRLIEYIDENIEHISSLADICNELHYSKNYVIRIFKKELGASPFTYINEVRMNKAMYLIKTTSRPIDEIARLSGYSDYSYFYKRFVRKNGISPLKWRKWAREHAVSE